MGGRVISCTNWRVYGRGGMACLRCDATLKEIRLTGPDNRLLPSLSALNVETRLARISHQGP